MKTESDFRDALYATIYADESQPYGHINIHVNNFSDELGYGCKPSLKITCQIGNGLPGDRDCDGKPYAFKYGVSHDYDVLSAHELEVCAKFMRKVERRLTKHYEEYGRDESSFTAFAYPILKATGVKDVLLVWNASVTFENEGIFSGKFQRTLNGTLRDEMLHKENLLSSKYARKSA